MGVIFWYAEYIGFTYKVDNSMELTFFILLGFLILFFPLLFTKEKVYKLWRKAMLKFTAWYLPLALVITYFGSDGGGGFSPMSFGVDWFASIFFGFFLIVSYLYIIYKSWKYRS